MGLGKLRQYFENLSVRQKVLYSTIVMFVLIGVLSSLAYWIIFFPSITGHIQRNSLRMAHSIVTRCRSYILADDRPRLTGILFQKKGIEEDLLYIFITGSDSRVLAHTFIPSIPEGVEKANILEPFQDEKIRLITVKGTSVYDAAVDVKEGLKSIGTVHIGVGKKLVDALALKMGLMFIVVMIAIILLAGLLSNLVANHISRPLFRLTKAMDDLCMGRTDYLPQFSKAINCWEILNCKEHGCPVFEKKDVVCWFESGTLCHGRRQPAFPQKIEECYHCDVYKRGGGDEIVQLSSSFSNIIYTLQLKAMEIRRSEEKYRLLFQNDPNPLFVVETGSAMILDVNDPAVEAYRYGREEMMQMSLLDLLHAEDAKRFWKEVQNEPNKEYFFLPRSWAEKKDGSRFSIDLHARVAKFGDAAEGTPDRSLIIRTVDITDRLERESQLIQAGKMATIGEMATGIAHELNQPLNVIKIGADFFKKMITKGDKISDALQLKVSLNMSEQVDRATNIINHLRDFGRKAYVKLYPVDINEPIRNVFTLLGQQLRLRDIEVELELEENLPRIMAGKHRMEQIFLNLVTNARDALEVKGGDGIKRLGIRTYQEKQKVIALVSDTGTGMPKEICERIFEPFFTTKEVGKGTGLGLSITYNLVKDFEGTIEVESIPDMGTTFRLSFPILAMEGDVKDE